MLSKKTKSLSELLTFCGMAALSVVQATAGEGDRAGVVRISDRAPVRSVSAQCNHDPQAATAEGWSGDGSTPAYGDCPDCYGHGGHGWGNCRHCGGRGCRGCLFNEHYCTLPPDYGFSVPAKYPVMRRGVQYQHYYPAAWNGSGQSMGGGQTYPQVYMPTDTTQMGFYYQHVPFWMPNPNMLPPRPVPSQWHHQAAPHAPSRWASTGCRRGHGYGYDAYGSCPVDANGTVIHEQPANLGQPPVQGEQVVPGSERPLPPPVDEVVPARPAPGNALPPAPLPNEAAKNWNIRRASAQAVVGAPAGDFDDLDADE